MRSFVRLLKGQAIALLALLIALSGTAYAAKVAVKNSVHSSSIKNGAVRTVDLKKGAVTSASVKDDSLTGADVDESGLGQVPSALTAQLGGQVWASPSGACTPATTSTYEMCTQKSLTMPAAGQLVLVGQVGISHRTDNQYEAIGNCHYVVNGVAGTNTAIVRNAGSLPSGWAQGVPLLYAATVPAGPVTVGIWCVDVYYSKFSDVKFVAMAAAPTP